mgnify:CR=1 FL=1
MRWMPVSTSTPAGIRKNQVFPLLIPRLDPLRPGRMFLWHLRLPLAARGAEARQPSHGVLCDAVAVRPRLVLALWRCETFPGWHE